MKRPMPQPLASESIRFLIPAGILALFSLQQRTLSALIGFILRTEEYFKPAARVIEIPWPERQEWVSKTQECQAKLKAALQSRPDARFLTLTARLELESTSYADGYAQGFAAAPVIRQPDHINRSLLFDILMPAAFWPAPVCLTCSISRSDGPGKNPGPE